LAGSPPLDPIMSKIIQNQIIQNQKPHTDHYIAVMGAMAPRGREAAGAACGRYPYPPCNKSEAKR
jgi:hypothetical protein